MVLGCIKQSKTIFIVRMRILEEDFEIATPYLGVWIDIYSINLLLANVVVGETSQSKSERLLLSWSQNMDILNSNIKISINGRSVYNFGRNE
ncbi:hypothetical protein DesyoDRAFT_3734 [Desulfosporosinus youngiae DSM 17734]|uniref:Uncharacterized protein n=1 Tax=Desulfosporosinus youngiae DSM 17734 TaxID=768710 RepID=H5XWS6_9FIRM|nr:hypothetical protein DesyoDRAFT_3734 [Desulfosporosinus youngiae DSM 17734]